MTPRIRSLTPILWVLLLGFSSFALAQDYRGTIKGRIADNTGVELPGVSVTVTNVATNVSANAVTDAKGFFRVPYLNAGTYDVTAKLTGLQPVARKGISVNVGSVLTVDLVMTIGVSSEIVVTGGAPLLDQTSPVTGQVVTREQIKELPLADGTAYMLSRIAPGIVETSDLHFSRPGDNANLGGVVANGVRGGNDFTLDGAPNIVSDRRVGFSPPSDAIAEFKVETNAFDAQSGHTAGAVINLALRSGTNAFHGSASYFNRSSDRTAKSPFQHKAGQDVISRDYDRFSAMLAGPIVEDSTFFMVAYEKLEDLTGEPVTWSVPTEKMRRGDFSELLGLGIKIYDPLTGTSNRKAFEGNIIPTNRLNPIALALLKYYPMPNQAGKSDQTNNYYSPQDRTYDYNSVIGRIDQSLSGGHQLFLNAYWNQRLEDRYNWAGVVEDFAVTQGVDTRDNFGTTLGYTGTFSSSLVGDLRLSYSKFGERRSPSDDFDPASLGFSPATVELFRGYDYLPRFDIAGFATLGANRSDYTKGFNRPFYNYSAAPSVTWLLKDHTVRAGYDFRFQEWWRTDDGYLGGRYNFTGAYTRANNSAAIQQGQALAQFLLGLPTSGGNSLIDWNTYGDYNQMNHALYVNDEWRLGRKLTINAGLRLEVDQGLTESNDWNIYGFDLTSSNPVEAAAKAAYAANPIPEIPVSQFAVRGGLLYGQGATWDTITKVLPRLGASYVLTDKTVVRGGIGLFSFPYFFDNINQTGFSAVDAPRLDGEQRRDVHRRPQQPLPERPHSADRLLARPRDLQRPGPRLDDGLADPAGPQEPDLHALVGRGPSGPRQGVAPRRRLRRQRGQGPGGPQGHQLRPAGVPLHEPVPRHGGRGVPERQRPEPLQGAPPGDELQRVDDPASPAPQALLRVRPRRGRGVHRDRLVQRPPDLGPEAVQGRVVPPGHVHLVEADGRARLPGSDGRGAHEAALARRPSAPRDRGRDLQAAVRQGAEVGLELERPARRDPRRLAADGRLPVPGGPAHRLEQQPLLRPELQAGRHQDGLLEQGRRDRRLRPARLRHGLLLLPRRAGPHLRPAHRRQRREHPDLPDRHRQRPVPGPPPPRLRHLEDLHPLPGRHPPGPVRGDQRPELHGLVEPRHQPAERDLRLLPRHAKQPARLADRGQAQLLMGLSSLLRPAASLLLAAGPLLGAGGPTRLAVTNGLDLPRAGETVAVPSGTAPGLGPSELAKVAVVDEATGKPLLSQAVDSDGDGKHDLLVFQADFGPGETRRYVLKPGERTAPRRGGLPRLRPLRAGALRRLPLGERQGGPPDVRRRRSRRGRRSRSPRAPSTSGARGRRAS